LFTFDAASVMMGAEGFFSPFMKIGFLTTSMSGQDGWGRYSKSLVEAASRFAEVEVLTAEKPAEDFPFPVHPVLPAPGYRPLAQLRVFLAAKRFFHGCDLIHSLVEPYAPGAGLASRFLGAKFLMTLHGTYSVPSRSLLSFAHWGMKIAYRCVDMTTTGSLQTEQKARERMTFGECRFIPNGVDAVVFRVLPDASREEFILTTGAVKSRKGADIVVEAMGLLKDEFPQLKYVIAGDTSATAFVEKLRSRAQQLGVDQRVDIRGIVTDAELVRLYNTCRVFVLAARESGGHFEGFPMVFFEANACGAPVITTRGFGSEYAIQDGENGFLVQMESPAEVAEAVRRILRDSGLQSSMKERALAAAAAHTWPAIAENFLLPMYRDTVAR